MTRLAKHVRLATEDDGGVLLDLASDNYFALNQTAAEICKGLQNGDSLAAVCDGLTARYGLEPSVAQLELEEFLQALADNGWLDG